MPTIKTRVILYLVTIASLFGILSCQPQSNTAQGYIEGRFSYISANYQGILQELNVSRGMQVVNGQQLFILDQEPELASQQAAQAKLIAAQEQKNQTQSSLQFAQVTLQRDQDLYAKKTIPKQTLDSAQNDYNVALANYNAALANLNAQQAQLTQANWTQQQKTVFADKSALVFDTYYLPGEIVPAGHPVLSLLAPQDIKVIFYISEEQLSKIQLNQKIMFSCDQCRPMTATVSFISPQAEYTPPVIYSEETRSKLVYRIEAIPVNPVALHPGQPVTVSFANSDSKNHL